MTLNIPQEKWNEFFNDLSKRRFGWETKIEVLKEELGDQLLSEGLPLNGITFEAKKGKIEILVGETADQHQAHPIINPIRVSFLGDKEFYSGVLEIEEANKTKTLVRIINPMPVYVGYAGFKIVAV